MRPVHVVILLLAGALSGALLMKVVPPSKPAVHTAVAPQVQPPPAPAPVQPAPEPAVQPEPAPPEPAPAVAETAKPSPMPPARPLARREAPKPPPVRTVASVAADPAPIPRPPPPPADDPAPDPAPTTPAITPPPATPEPEPAAPAPAPQPHQVTLNAGLLLPVRLVDGLSSERNVPGDVFQATLDKELVADGFVIAERGARVEGRVVAVDRAKPRAAAALAVELTRLHTSDGQNVAIQTENYFKHADPSQVDNTTKIAGGAIIGAAIGAIAGGGKGAAIGAGVGGGAGAGDVLLVRGKPAELPSETLVTFKLKSNLPLTEKLQ